MKKLLTLSLLLSVQSAAWAGTPPPDVSVAVPSSWLDWKGFGKKGGFMTVFFDARYVNRGNPVPSVLAETVEIAFGSGRKPLKWRVMELNSDGQRAIAFNRAWSHEDVFGDRPPMRAYEGAPAEPFSLPAGYHETETKSYAVRAAFSRSLFDRIRAGKETAVMTFLARAGKNILRTPLRIVLARP